MACGKRGALYGKEDVFLLNGYGVMDGYIPGSHLYIKAMVQVHTGECLELDLMSVKKDVRQMSEAAIMAAADSTANYLERALSSKGASVRNFVTSDMKRYA